MPCHNFLNDDTICPWQLWSNVYPVVMETGHTSHSIGPLKCFGGTGFWTQGLHLEPALFCIRYFQDRVSHTICPGWLRTAILLLSVSRVARFTGMSHWHPAALGLLNTSPLKSGLQSGRPSKIAVEYLLFLASPWIVSCCCKPLSTGGNSKSYQWVQILRGNSCFGHMAPVRQPSKFLEGRGRELLFHRRRGVFTSRWLLQNHDLQTSCTSPGQPFPGGTSEQHVCLCAGSTVHVHGKADPCLASLWKHGGWKAQHFCHGTVNIYTIIKTASTTIFFLLLSFNTFL
jgi:hypothetical protein